MKDYLSITSWFLLFRDHERLYIFIFNVFANRLPSVPSINMVHPEPSKTKMVCVYWQQTSLTKRPTSSFGFGKNNIIPLWAAIIVIKHQRHSSFYSHWHLFITGISDLLSGRPFTLSFGWPRSSLVMQGFYCSAIEADRSTGQISTQFWKDATTVSLWHDWFLWNCPNKITNHIVCRSG